MRARVFLETRSTPGPGTPTRVLVVDDSEADATLTVRKLQRLPRNLEITVSSRVDQAAFMLSSVRFDIAFVDYHMGDRLGTDLIKLARRQGVLCPMVLLTGVEDEELERSALELGASDFLTKAEVTPRGLERTIRYGLHRAAERTRTHQLTAQLEAVIEGSNDGIWDWGLETGEIHVSARFLEILGAPSTSARRISLPEWMSFVHPGDRDRITDALRAHAVGSADMVEEEYRVVLPDGAVRWMYLRGKAQRSASGRLQRIAGSQSDITDRKHREETIRLRSLRDPLTGLANREDLGQRIQLALGRFDRDGHAFALVYLDLDGFKAINDTHGHSTGDQVLREVGQRLLHEVSGGDCVARVGGDEFVVLLEGCGSLEDARGVGRRIEGALLAPILAEFDVVSVGASWGVCVADHTRQSAEELIAAADDAMYEQKALRRSDRA